MPTESTRPVPQGDRSIGAGMRAPLLFLSDGSAWNGPSTAPASVIPQEQPVRGWAYPVFWNASGDARSSKARETFGVSFPEFAELSKQVHVRAAIETVKNTQCKRQWVFQLLPKPGELATAAAMRGATDPRLAQVAEFFESPDGEHDLAEWLRMILEDLLVHDAATLYNPTAARGSVVEVEVFAGSTIKPLLAPDGRAPRKGEAYQQWLYGSPGDKFTAEEMIYSPRNPTPGKAYGCSPVEQLLLYINIALRKDLQRLATYTDGNIPAGLLPMPEKWTGDEITRWWTSFNTMVKGLPSELVKLLPIPGGVGDPIFPALDANKDLWEESWIRLVCFAFDIPVQSLVKEMTRATAESAKDTANQDGQAAYTDWIRRLLNRVIRKWFGWRDIVAIPKRESDIDPKTQAEIDDLELARGTLQINEKREREGRPPIKELDGKVGFFGLHGFMLFDSVIAGPPTNPDGESTPALPDPARGPETESAKAEHKFASTQVNVAGPLASKILALAEAIPVEALASDGREGHPHVTVKYGIAADVTVDSLREALAGIGEIDLTLGATAHFEADGYDVVYLEVDSPGLVAANNAIRAAVDTTDTQPGYVPHVTLARVAAGTGRTFDGDKTLSGETFTAKTIYFMDADGVGTEIPLASDTSKKRKRRLVSLRRPKMIEARQGDLTKATAALFRKQAPTIAAATVASVAPHLKAKAEETDEVIRATVTIDWSELRPVFEGAISSVYEESADATHQEITGSPFEKANERAAEYARARGGELITDIEETTRNRINGAVEKAIEDGLDHDALTDLITGIVDDEDRAENIAYTELASAQIDSALEAARESGVAIGKQSLLSNNHAVDDVCDDNADAGVIGLDEDFPSGDDGPPFHPGGCGCDVVIVVEDAE